MSKKTTGSNLMWGVLVLMLAGVCIAFAMNQTPENPVQPAQQVRASFAVGRLEIARSVPPFSFTDRSGKTVSRDDLSGNVWVASFIFTNCADTCPAMTARLQELSALIDGVDHVRLVSFSVDPERDSLKALNEYAGTYGITDPHWYFLRGERKEIIDLCVKGFSLAAPVELEKDPDQLVHSSRFVLVDKTGRIRGLYKGTGLEGRQSVAALQEDIRTLLNEE